MVRNYSTPELRPESPIHIALGSFLLIWIVWFIGLIWGNSGSMPGILMGVFNFVYVDILYRPVWELLSGVLPASSIGFYTASTIGYTILSLLVAAWFHVLSIAR